MQFHICDMSTLAEIGLQTLAELFQGKAKCSVPDAYILGATAGLL